MKVFPVYMNSLMKSAALLGSPEFSTDDRTLHRLAVTAMGVEDTQALFYPRLLPLVRETDRDQGEATPKSQNSRKILNVFFQPMGNKVKKNIMFLSIFIR